ncbi:MAG: hypothetical protein OEZ47_07350 [Gammaproteobacteria bacterium]|nr:hypothetical protein [Gammaproteobacteria bacterium]
MKKLENPFTVKKPDDMEPSFVAQYFVDTHTDFKKLAESNNSFLNGPRGTGKSMLLRSMEMTVASERNQSQGIEELDYLGIHVPLRREDFGITEIVTLINTSGTAIGEHLLCMCISYHLVRNLIELSEKLDQQKVDGFIKEFSELFEACGGVIDSELVSSGSVENKLHNLQVVCEKSNSNIRQYAKRILFSDVMPSYTGALCGLRDFLLPLIREMKFIGYFPKKPIYLMLDDADNLPRCMQRVINSWISMRLYPNICLKVSTQLGYATYLTLDNRRIESPHDFTSIDVGSVYTNSSDRYSKRVQQIVQRRLELSGIIAAPQEFFPEDESQKRRLEEIKEEIRSEYENGERDSLRKGSSRVTDEVTRYAVPRLMRELHKSKSSHTFSYAGYSSLVNLSSGIIRWFLEPAAQMFDEVYASSQGEVPRSILPRVQNEVIYRWSKEFSEELVIPEVSDIQNNFVSKDESSLHQIYDYRLLQKLHNLITALGIFFRNRLLDENASEQRAFSVVVRQKVSAELQEVLSLGIRLGYLQRTDNSAKELNEARRPRYILARRLGPAFKLDISGYAAHLSVTAEQLEIAIKSPEQFVKSRTRAIQDSSESHDQYELDLASEG